MSRLSVFYGEDRSAGTPERDEPVLVSYTSYANRGGSRLRNDPVHRARTLRENDRCPRCQRSLVEPLELADGLRSRNQLPIPGTATLVGFHCQRCHWEWPA